MRVVVVSAICGVIVVLAVGATERLHPEPLPIKAERVAPMVLNGYSRYPARIGSAPVYDINGHRVGLVQKLETGPMANPTAMTIWLSSGQQVRVAAPNISYDEQENIVTVGLTDAELGISKSEPAIH
jgi:hypothetical protein